jgi:glycosyltransferase involved in cell wall biosynthesis
MNIVFLWTGVTAPMAACWRALAATPGVSLTVFSELHRHAQTAYDEEALLAGIDHHLRYSDEPLDRTALADRIAALRPDVMIVLGWRSEMCRAAVESPALAAVPKLLAFDLQFAYTFRKLLAPLVLRPYLSRFAGAFVPGERSAEYARWLGFPDAKVERGITGLDTAPFAAAAAARNAAPAYPRKFLYVGRYAPEKGLDVLLEAYGRYRAQVANPWSLTCCGMGPEAARLTGLEGVADRGFVQPADLPAIYGEHGAFVLASRYEPWGFVIQEAAAAGLPIICTAACGAHVELVRDQVSGRVCKTGDVASLTEAMLWIDAHEASLPTIGSRSLALAEPYATHNWAARVLSVCQRFAQATPA